MCFLSVVFLTVSFSCCPEAGADCVTGADQCRCEHQWHHLRFLLYQTVPGHQVLCHGQLLKHTHTYTCTCIHTLTCTHSSHFVRVRMHRHAHSITQHTPMHTDPLTTPPSHTHTHTHTHAHTHTYSLTTHVNTLVSPILYMRCFFLQKITDQSHIPLFFQLVVDSETTTLSWSLVWCRWFVGPFTLQHRLGPSSAQLGLGKGWCVYICYLDQISVRSSMSLSLQMQAHILHRTAMRKSLPLPIFHKSVFVFLAKEHVQRRLELSICSFLGYPENAKYLPNKNCISCSNHKIMSKLAYLSVEMMSLDQKHKNHHESCSICVPKLRLSFKGIKSSGKLPISM